MLIWLLIALGLGGVVLYEKSKSSAAGGITAGSAVYLSSAFTASDGTQFAVGTPGYVVSISGSNATVQLSDANGNASQQVVPVSSLSANYVAQSTQGSYAGQDFTERAAMAEHIRGGQRGIRRAGMMRR